jgi:hypothetical protein
MFIAMRDATGTVFEWNAETGGLREAISTEENLLASFSGDGNSIVTLGMVDSRYEIARYDLASGERVETSIGAGSFCWMETNGAGDITYLTHGEPPRGGDPGRPPRLTFAREGEVRLWFPRDLLWTEDLRPALAVDRRGTSAVLFAENDEGEILGHLVNEGAAGNQTLDYTDLFVPQSSLEFAPGEAPSVANIGDGSITVVTGSGADTRTRVLDAGDAAELHAFDGAWRARTRSDRRVAMAGACEVGSGACRRLVVLSFDQQRIEDDLDHDGAAAGAPWPYGHERSRTDSIDNGVIYWRHFDPTGLGLPCLLHVADDELRCR